MKLFYVTRAWLRWLIMLPLPSFFAPAFIAAKAINQLLQRETWAAERLSAHAGKTARFVAGSWSMTLSVQSTGQVEPSHEAIVPDVILTIPREKFADAPAALRSQDAAEIAALMHVQGDAGFAHVVSDLARSLRWDIEHDLAGVVGDVVAVRLLKGVKNLFASMQESGRRLGGNVGEYLSEESQLILGRPAYEEWRTQMQAFQDRLNKVDLLVARLERKTMPVVVSRA